MNELYERITKLCEEKGVSRFQFCKDTGIQPSLLTDLKAGRQHNVKAEKAAKIAYYFGVTTDYILYGTKKEPDLDQDRLVQIEHDLIRCWRQATDIERQTIATLLSPYGMQYPKTEMARSRSDRTG
jgi:transcriptional regulator with XRE-family HTH domain